MKKLSILLMVVLLISVLSFPLPAIRIATAAPLREHVARVWTSKREYKVGETVKIYYRVEPYPEGCPIPTASARLTITKPDATQVVYDLGEMSVGTTYFIKGTAGEPLGRREILFEAWGICGCY